MGIPYAEVIGDPIAHSKSPLIHKFWLEKLGMDGNYGPAHVRTDGLLSYLAERRADSDWRGCNVTIPHKATIVESLDLLSTTARAVGAVNCVVRMNAEQSRLVGYNTDVSGFLEPLRPWLDRDWRSRFATVIGTGGAAAAICHALAKFDFVIISYARDSQSAAVFRRQVGLDEDPKLARAIDDLSGTRSGKWDDRGAVLDLLVNATPLGMAGFPPLEVNLEGGPPQEIVYDLVYAPLETPLLRDARALGLPTIDGLQMLVGQAAAAFELFFDVKPPREHDDELRELLMR